MKPLGTLGLSDSFVDIRYDALDDRECFLDLRQVLCGGGVVDYLPDEEGVSRDPLH
jgi:hypothetical protein